MLFFTLGDVGVEAFDAGFRYSNAACADELQYASKGVELREELNHIFRYACVLHDNQDPFVVALIVPDKGALKEAVEAKGLDPESEQGKVEMLNIIQGEVDSYRKGGKHAGIFPERWLPSAVGICDEEFTIQNRMLNSTSKIVRGKVEEHYADLLAFLYTAEGKNIVNPRNIAAL